MDIEKFVEEQRFNEIIQYFENRSPDSETAYLGLALSYYHSGKINKAIWLLNELNKKNPQNLDAIYNLGKIYFDIKDFKAAGKWFEAYIKIDKNEWSVFDMLSEVFLSNGEFELALACHQESKKTAPIEGEDYLKNREKFLRERIDRARTQKKMALICARGLDSFIDDISSGLSDNYWVRKFIVSNNAEVYQAIEWGDIIWLEWANEVAMDATNCVKLVDKPVILRLHGYEIFRDFPSKINWNPIDRIIFVAQHKRDLLLKYFGNLIPYEKIAIIRNGIDVHRFSLPSEKHRNKKLVIVGNINYRKGLELLLQFFYELLQKDPEYELYIRGHYEDIRYKMAIEHMIEELQIGKNIIFEDRVADLNEWFGDKTFIVSSSIEESFHYTIGEGMSAGLKPIVHAWRESRDIWPQEYIFKNRQEFLDIILSDEYEPEKYRKFVLENHSLRKQLKQIKTLINELEERYFHAKVNCKKRLGDILKEGKLKEFVVIDGALTKMSGHNLMFARDYTELLKGTKVKIIGSEMLKEKDVGDLEVLPVIPDLTRKSLDIKELTDRILKLTNEESILFFQSGDYTPWTTILALLLSYRRRVAILYHTSSTLMMLSKDYMELICQLLKNRNNLYVFSTTAHASNAAKKIFYNKDEIFFTNHIYYYFHHKELFERASHRYIECGPKTKIGYFGISRAEKGFHHLPNLIKNAPDNFEFHIQLSPLSSGLYEELVLKAYNEIKEMKKVIFYSDMDPEDFGKFLFIPHISLMLYHPIIYYNRLSSIYTESLACGIPIIMTKDLWYCKELEQYKAGIGVNPDSHDEFLMASSEIYENYSEYSKNARILFENIFEKNNNKIFLEKMLRIVLDS